MSNEWRDLPTLADVAAAQAAGDIVEHCIPTGGWKFWDGKSWDEEISYRVRKLLPKTKKVRILGWVDVVSGKTFTAVDGWAISGDAIRYPKLDDEIEVPE